MNGAREVLQRSKAIRFSSRAAYDYNDALSRNFLATSNRA
jgi:hypothetical protein